MESEKRILNLQSTSQLAETLLDPPHLFNLDEEQKAKFLLFGALILDQIWLLRNRVEHNYLVHLELQVVRTLNKLVQSIGGLMSLRLPRQFQEAKADELV